MPIVDRLITRIHFGPVCAVWSMTSCNQTSLDFSADDLRCTIPRPAPPPSLDIYCFLALYLGLNPSWLASERPHYGDTRLNSAEFCGMLSSTCRVSPWIWPGPWPFLSTEYYVLITHSHTNSHQSHLPHTCLVGSWYRATVVEPGADRPPHTTRSTSTTYLGTIHGKGPYTGAHRRRTTSVDKQKQSKPGTSPTRSSRRRCRTRESHLDFFFLFSPLWYQ